VGRRRSRSREFYISCSGDECWDILDSLLDNVKANSIQYRVTSNGIWIKISGLSPEIKEAWIKARRIASSSKSFTRSRRGVRTTLEALFSKTRLTFPSQVLEEVLAMQGYPTTISGSEVRSTADPDTLVNAAVRIAEIFHSLPSSLRGSAARKMITAASAILGIEPEETIEEAERLGVLVRDPDTGTLMLVKEWKTALRMLLKSLRGRLT